MKRWLLLLPLLGGLMLSGCATTATTQSTVTAFHVWQGNIKDKSFSFERTKEQEDSLEYQSYERYVQDALILQSFTEKTPHEKTARFSVRFTYGVKKDTRIIMEPRDMHDPFWYMYPSRRGRYYDPFGYDTWQPVPVDVFEREVKIKITDTTTNKPVYEVTVVNVGRSPELATVMPYMIQSAFSEFPGTSGVPRVVTMTLDHS